MTDDQHGEGTPQGGGRWDPLPQGDYDDGATAFVKLPEGGVDALMASSDSPLAAPGHGYVPPQITVAPATTAGTDPAAAGSWAMPSAPVDGTQWHAPDAGEQYGAHGHAAGQHTGYAQQDPYGQAAGYDVNAGHGDGFTYHPGATGQWDFSDAAAENAAPAPAAGPGHGAPGHDVTGQWSIPVADDDLPDESGEFTASSLAEQWGGTAPATLPGGAPAPWATQPWAQRPAGPDQGGDDRDTGTAPAPSASSPEPASLPAPAADAYPEAPAEPAARPAPSAPSADGPVAGGGVTDEAAVEEEAAEETTTGTASTETSGETASSETSGETASEETSAGTASEETTGESASGEATVDDAGAGDEPEAEEAAGVPAEPPAAPAGDEETESGPEAREEPVTDPDAVAAHAARDEPRQESPADAGAPGEPAPAGPHEERPLASYVLRVNGADRPVTDAWIGESLLYVLRERLGLAGAKDGCSQGECGACNVQVDGRLVASCLVPAVTAAGSEVRTVEGLAADGRPSDVQRALARCGAVQCGFCVPGMAMTVHNLLEGNPAPTDLEARQALCGNLCRCSGYRGVLEAVREVVAERRAHSADAAEADADEPRIPHQAGPGAGGVNASAFGPPGPSGTPDAPAPHDQPYGDQSYGDHPYGDQPYGEPYDDQSHGPDGGHA
ncbi:2Fe-2S iron-sulfur cluster-binding protein [Streptomyces sp. NPDC093586]|uniref:2Fe-2S iron-sulfur cluster-binding protein n=1 Tax=Streptomyces sp. NPDC093586 TaxID=3366042 RepID=UPI00380D5C3F